jgi:hypothetical protein
MVYPEVSGLPTWSKNCKWYSSLPLGAVVLLFCESVWWVCHHNPLCCLSISVYCCCLFCYPLSPETDTPSYTTFIVNNVIHNYSFPSYLLPTQFIIEISNTRATPSMESIYTYSWRWRGVLLGTIRSVQTRHHSRRCSFLLFRQTKANKNASNLIILKEIHK